MTTTIASTDCPIMILMISFLSGSLVTTRILRYPLLTFLFICTRRFLSDLAHLSLHAAVLTLHLFQRSRATPRGWSDIHGSLSPKLPSCYIALNTAHISWLANLCCLLPCPFSYGNLYFTNCLLLSSSVILIYLVRYTHIICLPLRVPLHLRCSPLYFLGGNQGVEGHFRGSKFSGSLCRRKFSVQVVSILASTLYYAIGYRCLVILCSSRYNDMMPVRKLSTSKLE